jgi:hypothetical protein
MIDDINNDDISNSKVDEIYIYILYSFIFFLFIFLFIKIIKYISYKFQIIKRKYRRNSESNENENENSNLLSNDNYSDKEKNYLCILRNIFILKCLNFIDYVSNLLAKMPCIPKRSNNVQNLNNLSIVSSSRRNHGQEDSNFEDFLNIEI